MTRPFGVLLKNDRCHSTTAFPLRVRPLLKAGVSVWRGPGDPADYANVTQHVFERALYVEATNKSLFTPQLTVQRKTKPIYTYSC